MKICILNGNPVSQDSALEEYLSDLCAAIERSGHQVKRLDLREMDIRYCLGCFNCWVKTPGRCIVADDSYAVCRAAINAGLVLFASPVSMGFISAELKKTMDKMIPLIHPYMEIDQGEIHHRKRYRHYPGLGLLLSKGSDCDAEDLAIIEQSFRRLAINFKSRLVFSLATDQPVEEVLHAVNGL